MLINSLTLHAQVRTKTNQLISLNAIAEGGNAKRHRAEMRTLSCDPPNAETEVEAERNKEAQEVQLTHGAE